MQQPNYVAPRQSPSYIARSTHHPNADVGSDTEAIARSQPGMKLSQKVQVAKVLATEELTIWPLHQQLGRKPQIKVKQAALRPQEEKPGHNFSAWFLTATGFPNAAGQGENGWFCRAESLLNVVIRAESRLWLRG